jgi:hypothetical protein
MHHGYHEQTGRALTIDDRKRKPMHEETSCSSLIFRPGVRSFTDSGDGGGDFLEERLSEAGPLSVVPGLGSF